MGYAQWVVFTIINRSNFYTLIVKNLRTEFGKIHENGNKDVEIGVGAIEGKEIGVEQELTFSSCGREYSDTGTEGSFDIYLKGKGKLCHCYWDCPYWSTRNTWKISEYHPDWVIQSDGASATGALGDITIKATEGH